VTKLIPPAGDREAGGEHDVVSHGPRARVHRDRGEAL